MKIELTIDHCMEVLDQRLLIGSDKTRREKRKRFYFHVKLNEYQICVDGEIVESGQALEELLETYNNL